MPITVAERSWLEKYRKALTKEFPRTIQRMVLFGSKARGDDHPDSDLDVLLVVANEAGRFKRPIRRLGYGLAACGEAVPSILVYTQGEWEHRGKSGSPFRQSVERDKVELR